MRDEVLGDLRREMHDGFTKVHSRLDDLVEKMGSCRVQCREDITRVQGEVQNLGTAVGTGDNGSGLRGAVKRHEDAIAQTRGSVRMIGWLWIFLTGAVAALMAFKELLFHGGSK
jgi:hypothetical protein